MFWNACRCPGKYQCWVVLEGSLWLSWVSRDVFGGFLGGMPQQVIADVFGVVFGMSLRFPKVMHGI